MPRSTLPALLAPAVARRRPRASNWLALLAVGLAATSLARTAFAVEVVAKKNLPALVGSTVEFDIESVVGEGPLEFRWKLTTETDFSAWSATAKVVHTYDAPGHYPIIVQVKNEAGTELGVDDFLQTVHYPLTAGRPATSSTIVYDAARKRVFNVNPDNDSVTALDATTHTVLFETPVFRHPKALAQAPDGSLWIINQDSWAVAIVDPDSGALLSGFRLPYASRPSGIAMSPLGDFAYVTLQATGEVARLDVAARAFKDSTPAGVTPNGIAVSHDGQRILVTRFVSPPDFDAAGAFVESFGEVTEIGAEPFAAIRTMPLPFDHTPDADENGRGVPNHLGNVLITPDGREAWVVGKKDNMARGPRRDGLELTFDSIVRPLLSKIDLAANAEAFDKRRDMNDREGPIAVAFSPLGDYAFVALRGSNVVEVLDAYQKTDVLSEGERAGLAPQGLVLSDDGLLFVHSFMSRSIAIYDAREVLTFGAANLARLTEVTTSTREPFTPSELLGKQIFYNAQDARMSEDGYMSCASCHLAGFEDGRVWDLSGEGEGFRNTITLLGRRGAEHGKMHWSGNFDEVQDFERVIRHRLAGKGFFVGDLGPSPLEGTAPTSPELDALAAYLKTFENVYPSPFRNCDGSLTDQALRGQALFDEVGCSDCHTEPEYTDSPLGNAYDIGTIKETSGGRLGQTLSAIDTPTLLGVWATPPYFHDGSALTLQDVLTKSPLKAELVAGLSSEQVDDLVAFVRQIDGNQPVEKLPGVTDPCGDGGTSGTGGAGGGGGSAGSSGTSGAGGTDNNGVRSASGCSLGGELGGSRFAGAYRLQLGRSICVMCGLVALWAGRRRVSRNRGGDTARRGRGDG